MCHTMKWCATLGPSRNYDWIHHIIEPWYFTMKKYDMAKFCHINGLPHLFYHSITPLINQVKTRFIGVRHFDHVINRTHEDKYKINFIPKKSSNSVCLTALAFSTLPSLYISHLGLITICCKPSFTSMNLLRLTMWEANLVSAIWSNFEEQLS